MSRTALWNLFKYALAFGLLGYVIWSNWQPGSPEGLEHVWNKHAVHGEPIRLDYLAYALVIMSAAVALTLVRWYYLVRAQGLPFRIADAFRLGLVGYFFNTVLPGSVGGDIIKAAGIAREQSRRTVAVATVIMDRVIALWGLIWFVTLLGGVFWWFGLVSGPSVRIVAVAAIIIAVSVVVWLLMGFLPDQRAERFAGRLERLPKVGGSAAEFWRAVWMYRQRQGTVAVVLLISWIAHAGFVLAFYFSALALLDPAMGPIPGLTEHFLLVPIGLVIQATPLFPGGAGIGEAGFGALYTWFGCAAALGVLGSLVQRVLTWVIGLIGYFIYLRMRVHAPQTIAGRVVVEEPSSGAPAKEVSPAVS